MPDALAIAQTILTGFDKHYRLFRETSAQAKIRFEQMAWGAVRDASRERIAMYDLRVGEAVSEVLSRYPGIDAQEEVWPRVKLAYIGLLHEHLQPELAETFYNSVACHVLHHRYYHNGFIFWRPAISIEHLEGREPTYRCFYPQTAGLRKTFMAILEGFELKNRFANIRRDIANLVRAVRGHFPRPWKLQPNFQIQVLRSLFYRNKAAYIVGRVLNGNHVYGFTAPLVHNSRGELVVDALLLKPEHVESLFGFNRAYFMVDMEVPSAYVSFLRTMMPYTPRAELYTTLGLQKQGKTLFYRDLQTHLRHSGDQFISAPGIKGMVMLVFTQPSYPYVFKIIKDYFAPPKEVDRATVKEKYQLVKYHDRVGRMADTLEYSNVAFPLDRFDPKLIEELQENAASSIEITGNELIVKHLYIERRMTPLNLYLQEADERRVRHAVRDYGQAIKDLASANIFPGDMLVKNFGVTRHGKVVFYDYDEIVYMTECNFRHIPPPPSYEAEMDADPWYTAAPNDVFPEQFAKFLLTRQVTRGVFLEFHRDLCTPEFWLERQKRIREGIVEDFYPYPETLRFCKIGQPRRKGSQPGTDEH